MVKSAASMVVVGVTRPFLYCFWNTICSREDSIGGCGIRVLMVLTKVNALCYELMQTS